ncbi:hypothetical protein D068_cds04610 [Bacillus atrophaeus UCMB-5137]|nr:hypothetical protein D068_cds04610 [Bacillus atrophaeus UCMB-5137]
MLRFLREAPKDSNELKEKQYCILSLMNRLGHFFCLSKIQVGGASFNEGSVQAYRANHKQET